MRRLAGTLPVRARSGGSVLLVAACLAGCVGRAGTFPSDAADAADAGVDGATGGDGGAGTDASLGTDALSGTDGAPTATDAAPPPAVCPSPGAPLDCSPGTGTGLADQCFDGTSCYISDVQSAVMAVIAAYPSWFDYANPTMCPFILDVEGFMNAVVADLVARGHCAIRDPNAPGEEVTVKHDNAFSENFDIVASSGCARFGPLIYTGYCAPAWW